MTTEQPRPRHPEYLSFEPAVMTPQLAEMLGEFDDLSIPFEDTVTNERLADELLTYICPAGEPWTGDAPWEDHGHTQCMWIGLAIKRLRAAQPCTSPGEGS